MTEVDPNPGWQAARPAQDPAAQDAAWLAHDEVAAGALARAKTHLEWARLEQAVMGRCRGRATQRRGLPVEHSLVATRMALSETAEAHGLLRDGEPLPLDDLRDVDAHLARVARDGDLDGPALSDLRVTLRNARALRRFIYARRERLPALHAVCHIDPTLDTLEEELGASIGLDGSLHDHASPDLRKLRAECSNLRARIIGRLQELIEQHHTLLSDRIYTQREGRYVVPVRTDAHDRFPGIVHATSDSGASIFVEPRAIVAQGNRLKMAQGELAREEARILAALSALVAERIAPLHAAVATLERCDLRNASGALARDLDATVPELAEDGTLALSAARHPLLMLDGVDVVPNDVTLSPGHGVVVSGPNAGGKTVLLKTLGLFALMVRAGLAVPAGEGSVMGYFDQVLSDLGDEQSTEKNLSTFSAHVTSLASVLSLSGPRSLVLLDELCGGTDPEEGAALACAVVDRLCQTGATVLVTTHYEPLKAFSLRNERMRSASVGFDLEHMLPNFALTWDVPGASSALRVAERFGIPRSVIEAAKAVLPQQAKDFDALVRQLQAQATQLQAEHARAAAELARAESLRREHEQRLVALKERSQRKLTAEGDKLMAEIREARATLRQAKGVMRKAAQDPSTTATHAFREAEAALNRVAGRAAVGGDLEASLHAPATAPVDAAAPKRTFVVGDEVYVPHLRSRGTIIEADSKSGRYRVSAGALKLWADDDALRVPGSTGLDKGEPRPPQRAPEPAAAPAVSTPEHRTSDNTVTLKGMRVDDALPMLETFIDRLLLTSNRMGYVVHGHGTGALRKAVRDHLTQVVPHVTRTRPGTLEEGGEAVTAFYLDD